MWIRQESRGIEKHDPVILARLRAVARASGGRIVVSREREKNNFKEAAGIDRPSLPMFVAA